MLLPDISFRKDSNLDLNLGPLAQEASALTTWLPRFPWHEASARGALQSLYKS